MIGGSAGATALDGAYSGGYPRLDVSRCVGAGRVAGMTGSVWPTCRSMSCGSPVNGTNSTCGSAFWQLVAPGDWTLMTDAMMMVIVGVAVAPDAVRAHRVDFRTGSPTSGGDHRRMARGPFRCPPGYDPDKDAAPQGLVDLLADTAGVSLRAVPTDLALTEWLPLAAECYNIAQLRKMGRTFAASTLPPGSTRVQWLAAICDSLLQYDDDAEGDGDA